MMSMYTSTPKKTSQDEFEEDNLTLELQEDEEMEASILVAETSLVVMDERIKVPVEDFTDVELCRLDVGPDAGATFSGFMPLADPANATNTSPDYVPPDDDTSDDCAVPPDEGNVSTGFNIPSGSDTEDDDDQVVKHKWAKLCPQCGRVLKSETCLRSHMRTQHSDNLPANLKPAAYLCGLCNKRFVSKFNLEHHENSHLKRKPHPCKVCPKRFAYKKDLRAHGIRKHGEPGLVCPKCNKTYAVNAELKRHQKMCGVKATLRCATCQREFKYKQSLTTHIKKAH